MRGCGKGLSIDWASARFFYETCRSRIQVVGASGRQHRPCGPCCRCPTEEEIGVRYREWHGGGRDVRAHWIGVVVRKLLLRTAFEGTRYRQQWRVTVLLMTGCCCCCRNGHGRIDCVHAKAMVHQCHCWCYHYNNHYYGAEG